MYNVVRFDEISCTQNIKLFHGETILKKIRDKNRQDTEIQTWMDHTYKHDYNKYIKNLLAEKIFKRTRLV